MLRGQPTTTTTTARTPRAHALAGVRQRNLGQAAQPPAPKRLRKTQVAPPAPAAPPPVQQPPPSRLRAWHKIWHSLAVSYNAVLEKTYSYRGPGEPVPLPGRDWLRVNEPDAALADPQKALEILEQVAESLGCVQREALQYYVRQYTKLRTDNRRLHELWLASHPEPEPYAPAEFFSYEPPVPASPPDSDVDSDPGPSEPSSPVCLPLLLPLESESEKIQQQLGGRLYKVLLADPPAKRLEKLAKTVDWTDKALEKALSFMQKSLDDEYEIKEMLQTLRQRGSA